jgi:hypothetical protein
MNRRLWIYSEDLAGAYVGPFDNMKDVIQHITFLHERGDASAADTTAHIEIRVMSDQDIQFKKQDFLVMSPERDRKS